MTWAITAISAASIIGGTAMQAHASDMRAKAAGQARLDEVRRQGSIMQDQMKMQDQQRNDALESRKKFQDQSLNAFTPEKIKADADASQTGLAQALNAAGARGQMAMAPTADATASTGAVSVQNTGGNDAPSMASAAYQNSMNNNLARISGINDQQSNAQAAMQALSQAQYLGGQRLQNSSDAIQLSGARLNAMNRPLSAQTLLSNASKNLYQSDAERAQYKGTNTQLAGMGLSTLGQIGLTIASAGAGGAGGGGSFFSGSGSAADVA